MAVEFTLPEGFSMPQEAQPGSTFDAVASLKLSDDGSDVTVVAIDGIPLKGESKGPDEQVAPPDGGAPPSSGSGSPAAGGYKSFTDAMG